MPSLILVAEDSQRQVFPLGKATLMVGRDEESEIHLPDDSVSRNHASIVLDENGEFVVRDNGSTNGTFVNGEPVRRAVLRHHDLIRFGDYTFMMDMYDARLKSDGAVEQAKLQADSAAVTGTGSDYRAVVNLRAKGAVASGSKVVNVSLSRSVPKLKLTLTAPVYRPIPAPLPVATGHSRGLVTASLICGCLGPVAFLPAIILGHLSTPWDERSRGHRRTGLMLGYFFLFLWLGAGWMMWEKQGTLVGSSLWPASKAYGGTIRVPSITEAYPLISGKLAWMPFQTALTLIRSEQSQINTLRLPAKSTAQSKPQALADFVATWRDGLILYEPVVLRIDNAPNPEETMRFILEDCFSPPTFKTGENYNSTVIPEKTPVVGPFYIPNLKRGLFYNRNPVLAARTAKFNNDQFLWRMAERGVQWPFAELPAQVRQSTDGLRWVVILKPSVGTSLLELETREGDLLHDYPRKYSYNIFPAEVVAEVVYNDSTQSVISLRLNEGMYSINEARQAKALIESNFKAVLANRPADDLEIPTVFTLNTSAVK